jgi:hypothetical protein
MGMGLLEISGVTMPKENLISKTYYQDPYYQSKEYKKKVKNALEIEQNRSDLIAKRNTIGAKNYARFLMAVENDASFSRGKFGKFTLPSDENLIRRYPFLKEDVKDVQI